MRRTLPAALLVLLLMGTAGCADTETGAGTNPTAAEVTAQTLAVQDVAVRPVDTKAGIPLRLASRWRIRAQSGDSVVVVGDPSSGVSITRRPKPAADYRERLERVADSLDEVWGVSGPIDTTLFGQPAAAVTVVGDGIDGKGYVRIYIGSADWYVAAERTSARFDDAWASEVARMLGDETTLALPER